MRLASIAKFLFGNREAIIDIATSRSGLVVGGLLVLSAGFAREYDAEYLVREPWHVLIPLGASLLVALPMFAMLFGIGKRRDIGDVGFWKTFRSFLVLFWMTAPLAWLYAIPFERFLDPIGATHANLWLLRIVSIWRVALMTRVVTVFFGCRIAPAFFCVIMVADIVMQIALEFAPLPIIQFMGGIRLSDTANIIAGAVFVMTFFGILTLPIWIIGVLVIAFRSKPRWNVIDLTEQPPRRTQPAIKFAFATVLVWFIVLPWTQAEQRLRYEAESLLIGGQIAEGLAFMSQYDETDFPPLWDPPPRPDFHVYKPYLNDVVLVMMDTQPAEWVQAFYHTKYDRSLAGPRLSRQLKIWEISPEGFEATLTVFEQLPNGPKHIARLMPDIENERSRLGDALVDRARKLASTK